MIMRGFINGTFATALILVSNLVVLFVEEMLFASSTASAQIPSVPSPPLGRDLIAVSQLSDLGVQSEPVQTPIPPNISTPTIQITSHQDGNQVPSGELTIQGTSSDNEESNCQVYADVNDVTPLQYATAAGVGGEDDYSEWTFTYSQAYQPITEGVNELTAKISCFDDGDATVPLSEWHSVNVTGLVDDIATPTPTMREAPLTESTLGGGQEPSIVPAPDMAPSVPFAASEEPLEDSSQDQGEEGENGGDPLFGGDDDGDDDGGEDDDDGGEDDDDGGEDDG